MNVLTQDLANLSIKSSNFSTLFPNLPVDIQSYVLNKLSLIDVTNLCSATGTKFNICSSDQYFQQRLVSKSVTSEIIARYQTLVQSNVQPLLAYVKALIDGRQINADPSLLIYLDESDVLFPGLEYFIGLGKMGIRAIDLNRSDYLLYVLQSYPSERETYQITGSLFMKYMKTGQALLSKGLLESLFQIQPPSYTILDQHYYPSNEPDYRAYNRGLSGYPLTRFDPEMPYLYGLIDGRQDRAFTEYVQRSFDPSNILNWNMNIFQRIREYTAMRGTVEMAKTMTTKEFQLNPPSRQNYGPIVVFFGIILDRAIEGDNLDVVNFLLLNYRSNIFLDIDTSILTPRSRAMFDMLKYYKILVENEEVLLGIMESGNYGFLLDIFGEDWYDKMTEVSVMSELIYAMSQGPAYLMSAYLTKFRESFDWGDLDLDPDNDLGFLMEDYLISNCDLYKEEILLSLGLKPDDDMKEMIINQMDDLLLKPIFGVNLNRYPELKKLIAD